MTNKTNDEKPDAEQQTGSTENPEIMEEPGMEELDPEEIQNIEGQIHQMHDILDEVKETGRQLSEQLSMEAQEAETEEKERTYLKLSQGARNAYRRIEEGDSNVRRGL